MTILAFFRWLTGGAAAATRAGGPLVVLYSKDRSALLVAFNRSQHLVPLDRSEPVASRP